MAARYRLPKAEPTTSSSSVSPPSIGPACRRNNCRSERPPSPTFALPLETPGAASPQPLQSGCPDSLHSSATACPFRSYHRWSGGSWQRCEVMLMHPACVWLRQHTRPRLRRPLRSHRLVGRKDRHSFLQALLAVPRLPRQGSESLLLHPLAAIVSTLFFMCYAVEVC